MRRSNATLGHGKVYPKVAADQRGHDLDVSLNVYTKTDIKQRAAVAWKLEYVVLGPRSCGCRNGGLRDGANVVQESVGFWGAVSY